RPAGRIRCWFVKPPVNVGVLMVIVREPNGRRWVVCELGQASNVANGPKRRCESTFSLSTLRVESGAERFVVSIGRTWRAQPNDDLWRRLARRRMRNEGPSQIRLQARPDGADRLHG